MTDAPTPREVLATALSVALHEEADPQCTGEPSYDVTSARAEALADVLMRMPSVAVLTRREPLDVAVLAQAIHAGERDMDPTDRPYCPACLADAQRYAAEYARLEAERDAR